MIILACEGKSELTLISELLDKGKLCFSRDDILDKRPLHIRQLTEIKALINTLHPQEDLLVYRIGDTQKDIMDLKPFGMRREHIAIQLICTKPEIEMLQIISSGALKEYWKAKSFCTPKEFIKTYYGQIASMQDYIDRCGIEKIVDAIKEYKRTRKHANDEGYLADLLNDS